MDNILIVHSARAKAIKALIQVDDYLKSQEKRCNIFWSDGAENLWELKNGSIDESKFYIEDLPFLFTLRHGGDPLADNVRNSIQAKEKYIFGGAGYRYVLEDPSVTGELPLIRSVNDAAPLTLDDIRELFTYAERTGDYCSRVLFFPDLEDMLKTKHAALAPQLFGPPPGQETTAPQTSPNIAGGFSPFFQVPKKARAKSSWSSGTISCRPRLNLPLQKWTCSRPANCITMVKAWYARKK